MTFQVSVKSDLKKLTKHLNNVQKKQIPYAASQALTDTAFDARKALRVQATKKLDRPTKFTINAFQVDKATKRDLRAAVYVHKLRWSYLKYQILGGSREVSGKGTGVPFSQKLNKFGNIPGRKKGLVKKKRQFVATIKGITGVWERTGGKRNPGIKLVTAFEKKVSYKKRFEFKKIVHGIAKSKFPKHFDKRLTVALKNMRKKL